LADNVVEFRKPAAPTDLSQLVGKLLMLNGAIAPKFQCGGFSVNPSRMVDVVTQNTQLIAVKIALDSGILIDVSSNSLVTKGFELKNSSTSNVQEEETDKKAFVGRDALGRMFVIVPKDDEERKKFEQQLAETGSIDFNPSKSDNFTGFSPIVEEELKPEPEEN
jgi:hypothetical protein